MPREPDPRDYEANPDFDAFRGAAADLLHNGQRVGRLACEVEQEWPVAGGRLWWRRWGRGHEYVYVVAELTSTLVSDFSADWLYADNDEEMCVLDDLHGGTYTFVTPIGDVVTDVVCEVRWLDGEARTSTREALLPHVEH